MAATSATCSPIKEQPTYSIGMARMMGLETAADLLGGKAQLGDVIGISKRAVIHKVTGQRGVSNGDLALAAAALEKLGNKALAHAAKLRDEARA